MPKYELIVIGASAGGVESFMQLVQLLPKDLPIPIFMVLHLYPDADSHLPNILTRVGQIQATFAQDGETIQPNHIYVAPPNRHMLVNDTSIQLSIGPKENHSRPAINQLFRSAAKWYGSHTIGIVLTGMLDDGTAGLAAIKAQGGLAIVQDPEEALVASMPRSAIKNVVVDHIVRISEMAKLLVHLTNNIDDLPSVRFSQEA